MSLTAPTVTGYSGFWQTTGDHAAYSMSLSAARAKAAKRIAYQFNRRSAGDAQEALLTLLGAAAGDPALKQFKQISAPSGPEGAVPAATGIGDFGGNRVIDTITQIDRVTTAADVTELTKWINAALLEQGISYPTAAGGVASQGMRVGVNSFA